MARSLSERVAIMGIYAALYVAATEVLAPISFLIFNIRVADALRGLLLFFPTEVIIGNFVGHFVANLFSPLGVIDLASPIFSTLGLIVAWKLSKIDVPLGYAAHWLILSTWLVYLLHQTLGLDYMILIPTIYPQVMVSDLLLPMLVYDLLKIRWKG